MYEAITKVYHDGNVKANIRNKGKIYNYSLLDENFRSIQNGKCKNVSYSYNPCYDCNFIAFEDIETGKTYRVCEFHLKLTKLSE